MDKDEGRVEQQPAATTWSQDRRFQFIDYRLRWDGRIRRTDLTEFFNISLPQASADLAKYQEAAQANMVYDLSQKAYLRAVKFEPLYPRSSVDVYLAELLAVSAGVVERKASFLGWMPEVGLAPAPGRYFDSEVLVTLVSAIREQRSVLIDYQSVKAVAPVSREISPTALANDGSRWHVRAYCHKKSAFQDFVIGRVRSAQLSDATQWTAQLDEEWNRILAVKIGPHPELSPAAKRMIELEYQMVDGSITLECRQSMLYYTVRRLRLDPTEPDQRPEVRQVILLNPGELQPYLDQVLGRETKNGSNK